MTNGGGKPHEEKKDAPPKPQGEAKPPKQETAKDNS
jgi:hypothetical protein